MSRPPAEAGVAVGRRTSSSSPATASSSPSTPSSRSLSSTKSPKAANGAPPPVAAPRVDMDPLLEALNDRDHPDRVRDAAATIRGSLKNNPENKARLLAAGGIDILVELLQYNDSTTVEHAVTALLNMALTDGVEPLITAAGGIEAISAVLRQGSLVARENAAAAVFVMSGPPDNKAMVRDAGAIEPLVSLLSQAGLRGRKDAALALFNLSLDESCVDAIVDAGAVHALLKVLRDPNMHRGMDDKAMAVIANLCKFDTGRQAVQDARGIPVLLAVVEWGSSRAKEDAAVSMYLLALHSVNAFQMILEEDAVPALTALSKSGTSRAKAKARALLELLRGHAPPSQSAYGISSSRTFARQAPVTGDLRDRTSSFHFDR